MNQEISELIQLRDNLVALLCRRMSISKETARTSTTTVEQVLTAINEEIVDYVRKEQS